MRILLLALFIGSTLATSLACRAVVAVPGPVVRVRPAPGLVVVARPAPILVVGR